MANKSAALDTNGYRKVGLLDHVSYAAGDFGCNMSFVLAGTWFTLFYTQYMGIDSLLFSGILVVLKVWDAINDPLIGGLIDNSKRKFKRGKFKTFIFWGSFGLMLSAALCFLPFPQAPQIVKVILCLVGYMAWDACYTVVNVPYGAMLSLISDNPSDRASLSAWRSLGAMLAQIPVTSVLPLVLYDENRNIMGQRLFVAALVLGVIGLVAFQFMIRTTIERVKIEPAVGENEVKFNYITAVKNFALNRPAIGATLGPVAMYLGTVGAATASQVMFQSYFKNTAVSGLFTLLMTLPMFFFIPFLRKIVGRFGKKEAAQKGLLFSVIVTVAMLFLPITPDGKGLLIFVICQLLNGVGMGVFMCVGNAMMADAIDYNEWKHGTREEGVTYALHSFFRKLAQGVGPSIGLVLMVALGYDEQLGASQPEAVALNMRYLVAAMFCLSAVLMWVGTKFVYNLDKETLAEMERDLKARHEG